MDMRLIANHNLTMTSMQGLMSVWRKCTEDPRKERMFSAVKSRLKKKKQSISIASVLHVSLV